MTRGRARRYLLTKQGYYPQVVADAGYTVFDWSTLNAGTLFQDSAKTTPASANGDVVGCWTDGVGGVDAIQATTANKPGLATASLNGLQTLSFDGGDTLTTTNIRLQSFSIWVVWKASNTNSTLWGHEGNTYYVNRTATTIRVFQSGVISDRDAPAYNDSTYRVSRVEYNDTHASHKIYQNNGEISATSRTAGNPVLDKTGPLTIGSVTTALFLTGNIAHLCIVSPYPTDASILVNMESYINGLWGVY